MIRAIFTILIICVIVAGAGFFVKKEFGFDAIENFDIDKITGTLTMDKFMENNEFITPKKPIKEEPTPPKKTNETDVYFLTAEGNESTKLATSKKVIGTDSERFRAAIEALFSGPSGLEKIAGVYSEIPPETKLLGIREDKNSYTINISDDFEYGGGADSMKIRVKQLVTTATQASGSKDVYLEINGKQAEYVGGEGIMILQPLQRNKF